MHDPFEALLGHRDATGERLEELQRFFVRTLHVHSVSCVVVRFRVLLSLQLWIGVLVQRFDEGKVAGRPLFQLTPPSARPPFFDGAFTVCVPEMVELLCVAFSENFLRKEVRLNRISRKSLTGSNIQRFIMLIFGMFFPSKA